MIILVSIVATVSLGCSVVALIISIKESCKKQEQPPVVVNPDPATTTTTAPMESPFVYDETRTVYTLDGSLEVTGSIACLKKKEVDHGI